jgi:hypothetical protein
VACIHTIIALKRQSVFRDIPSGAIRILAGMEVYDFVYMSAVEENHISAIFLIVYNIRGYTFKVRCDMVIAVFMRGIKPIIPIHLCTEVMPYALKMIFITCQYVLKNLCEKKYSLGGVNDKKFFFIDYRFSFFITAGKQLQGRLRKF